jgi:hypothetical protein
MNVEVVRSARRRKTVHARQVGDVLRVSIPATMSAAEERRWVDEMVRRIELRGSTDRIDLTQRVASLAKKFGLQTPLSVRWVDNQASRWGSCTPSDRTIRISSRLGKEPAWVLDYVLVHELAHLSVHGHNPRFWALVYRYPLTERARGFLMARGLEESDVGESDGEPEGSAHSDHSDRWAPARKSRDHPGQAAAAAANHDPAVSLFDQ